MIFNFGHGVTLPYLTAQYLESTFRVLINVSRLGVQWCKHLVADPLFLPVLVREILSQCDWAVKEEIVEVEEVTVRRDSLDRQCLALALLSNVLLAVDETKILLRDIGVYLYGPRIVLRYL